MNLSLTPLHPLFAAEVSGVDLRTAVSAEVFLAIAAALDRYAVLVFRDQRLSTTQQISFSKRFGPLEPAFGSMRKKQGSRLGEELLADVSNLDASGNIRSSTDAWRRMQSGNQLWHTDSSYKCVPGKISFLSAHELPPVGGQTEFADLRAAYEALDGPLRSRIEGLVAEHSIFHSRQLVGFTDFSDEERGAYPPMPRPVVRLHPGSMRMSLYLASHASHIVGMPVEDGRALLATLTDFATQPKFVHVHHWQLHDLLVWDNRCTMHRGRPYDDVRYRRDMRRTTVADERGTRS
jgi:alpha-ketoglutarate-dependent 2,4-dichlorophenoxyacetate dioxygenase